MAELEGGSGKALVFRVVDGDGGSSTK